MEQRYFICSFLFVQKRTNKAQPETVTARFRGLFPYQALCYREFNIGNFIVRFAIGRKLIFDERLN
jgi:hypothetical protein